MRALNVEWRWNNISMTRSIYNNGFCLNIGCNTVTVILLENNMFTKFPCKINKEIMSML